MDLATLIGFVLGVALIIGSILIGGDLMPFFNVPGLLIVGGGTLASTMINERMGNVFGAFKVGLGALFDRTGRTDNLIPRVIELASKARKEGLVALESETIEDPFLERGVRLGVDGLSPEVVVSTLTAEVVALKKRHMRGKKLFDYMGMTAPSMGMIGTLIGLVQMLRTMDDPATIGPSMAVALLTTLYGAVMAYLMFIPIGEKLASRTNEEVAHRTLAIQGVESILRGDNPMMIQSKLEAMLAPGERQAGQDDK